MSDQIPAAEQFRLMLSRAARVMTRPIEDPTPSLNSGTFFCRKLAESETAAAPVLRIAA